MRTVADAPSPDADTTQPPLWCSPGKTAVIVGCDKSATKGTCAPINNPAGPSHGRFIPKLVRFTFLKDQKW
jgi:hypothetical protein